MCRPMCISLLFSASIDGLQVAGESCLMMVADLHRGQTLIDVRC